ncbi:hypothetical protein GCM10023078_30860 [Gibbsiella greigii]
MFKMNKTMLYRPRKLTWPFGWCGHIPFVGWLIEEQRPRTIVELGTHSGNSYLAMCQSVLENAVGTKCYAVDTWMGDEHAGNYGEDVYNELFAYNQENYASFSNLMRMTFDEATNYFNDKSVDLLHIDGLHTYEAVKNDFDNWLPKMSDRGIVLFHDTNVHERNFGVWKLWEELCKQYPHFEFKHSHGLGVLFVGKESHTILSEKLNAIAGDEILHDVFARLGELVTLHASINKEREDFNKVQIELSEHAAGLEKHVQHLEAVAHERLQEIEQKNIQCQQQADLLETQSKIIEEKHADVEKMAAEIMAHQERVSSQDAIHQINLSKHSDKVELLSSALIQKQRELDALLSTRSWKITKPLRFIFRLLRGQYHVALQPVKGIAREKLKQLYYKTPVRFRASLLQVAFKVRPSWFQHHPQFLQAKGFSGEQGGKTQGLMIDINTLSDDLQGAPGKVAIHCHIFYYDLIDEFRQHLSTVPFTFDVFVSVTTQEAHDVCVHELRKVTHIGKLVVKIVPNRGRDIAPMFAAFGEELKEYDYIGHIQSKKSLYNGGTTLGWREYLFNALLGSTSNVKRIFSHFEKNPQLGIVYPQVFTQVPYAAFTWLANRAEGARLCHRMGVAMPESYFNFPAGSMFWARMDAMRPLFELNLSWDDFPEEAGQTDGTTAHAIERLLGIVPTATGYETCIIKDMQTLSWSPFRLDHQYLPRNKGTYNHLIEDGGTKVVAFDIFDTLLVRPLLNPEHTKQLVSLQLDPVAREYFDKYRVVAESQARNKKGKDVDLGDIYVEFSRVSGMSKDQVERIRSLEEQVELGSVSARKEAVDLISLAKDAGKRVVLISDMFLPKPTIEAMLENNGIEGWDKLYLSSDRGVRKDTGELYKLMMAEESVTGSEVVMIGDNERSDLQLPADFFGIRCIHLFRANDLARSLPAYESYVSPEVIDGNIDTEITAGLLVKENLNKIADFTENDINLFGSEPHQIGFNVVGPVVSAFCQWLIEAAKADKVDNLYFLAREGKLIKEIYDQWSVSVPGAPKSHYLQVSRRAVNVPNIVSFDDVKSIGQSDYFANEICNFLYERFGLELSEQRWQEIYNKGLWAKGRLLEIQQKNVQHIEPLLQFLLPDILNEARQEKQAMMQYLASCGFTSKQNLAVVDVGYSGTIQKALNRLVEGPVHGYYFATANNVRDGMAPLARTQGCYVNESEACFNDSRIFSDSFNLEKLLSASDPQIVKYVLSDDRELAPIYKTLREGELSTRPVRDELQAGGFAFVAAAVKVREAIYPGYKPSLTFADELYKGFTIHSQGLQSKVLERLILDDDYCGRGLIS